MPEKAHRTGDHFYALTVNKRSILQIFSKYKILFSWQKKPGLEYFLQLFYFFNTFLLCTVHFTSSPFLKTNLK